MIELHVALTIAAAFFFGSLVKGVAGIGLPLVAISILTFVMDVRDATPMIVGPAILANIYQIYDARRARMPLTQIAPIIAGLMGGVFVGALIAVSIDPSIMVGVMGAIVLAFVVFSFSGAAPTVPEKGRGPMGLAAGAGTGVIGGMTGVFGPVLAIYTLSLNLQKDAFVWAMGVLLLLSSAGLGISYASLGALPLWVAIASAGAIVPGMIGMWTGSKIRDRVSQSLFRKVVLAILGVISLKHIATAFGFAA